jgi:2-methylisocitrate lyase-like PEP mutase family enzyme
MAQCYARDASDGTLEDTIARLRAYREEAGVDWIQFESPHSIDKIRAARAAVTGLRNVALAGKCLLGICCG